MTTVQTVSAVVDCGSSHYIIVLRYNNKVHKITMQGEETENKVPATVYLPTSLVDIKRPSYNQFYFGQHPDVAQEYAFIPNWKNYFFDADEIVRYPQIPTVPSKNNRSVRVQASTIFEAFIYQSIGAVQRFVRASYAATSMPQVDLLFLIPSVTNDRHKQFLQKCINAVLSQVVNASIKMVYEAQIACIACNNLPIGDFGGFTFDKATSTQHEACNLAASNIDQVVDQLIRSEYVDLKFMNRNLLYDRIMHLKENYVSGDVVLDMTSIFYKFQFMQHHIIKQFYARTQDAQGQNQLKQKQYIESDIKLFLDEMDPQKQKLLIQYYNEYIITIEMQKVYAQQKSKYLEVIKLINLNERPGTKQDGQLVQQLVDQLSPTAEFLKVLRDSKSRRELKDIILKCYDSEQLCLTNHVENILIQQVRSLVKRDLVSSTAVIAKYMLDNNLLHWYETVSKYIYLQVKTDSNRFSGYISKDYIFTEETISLVIDEQLYTSIFKAVTSKIAKNFNDFLSKNGAKDFYITGGFSQSPFLVNSLLKQGYIRQLLGIQQNPKDYLTQNRTIRTENILTQYLRLQNPTLIRDQQLVSSSYTHYILIFRQELEYSEATSDKATKTRICIDEGTSGSILAYIYASTQYSDDLQSQQLPTGYDLNRMVNGQQFKGSAKIPSFCVVDLPLAFEKAKEKYSQNLKQLDKWQLQNLINQYFTQEMLSIGEIQQIFSFQQNYERKKAADTQQLKGLRAKRQQRAQQMQQANLQENGQPETQQKPVQAQQQAADQVENEVLIVDYWKRYLYAKQYIKFPFEPVFETRYTYNSYSINVTLPIAYFYIAHLSYFYQLFLSSNQDADKFYNSIGITLTVPCAAKEMHLTFLRECARTCNFPDDIVFVYEPNSSFSYLYNRDHYKKGQKFTDKQFVLVLDVGAGTTDISLLQIQKPVDQEFSMSQFHVENFFEINFAGNNIIDSVIAKLEITQDMLQKCSNRVRTSLRESIKQQIEKITTQGKADTNKDEYCNITIESYKQQQQDEKVAYEQIYNKLNNGQLQVAEQKQQILIQKFPLQNSVLLDSINEIQNTIFQKVLDFCILNKTFKVHYQVDIVTAGGFGGSKYFNEALKASVSKFQERYPFIRYLDVENRQDSIGIGGLYLKAEKDYVDLSAPFIDRAGEDEEQYIRNNPTLESTDISFVVFKNIELQTKIEEFTFMQKGQRWKYSHEQKMTVTAGCQGIEFIIFAKYYKSKMLQSFDCYAFLVRIPLEQVSLMHPNEAVGPAGVPQYLYEVDAKLLPPSQKAVDDNGVRPFTAIHLTVRISSNSERSPAIENTYNLVRYISTNNKKFRIEGEEQKIMLHDTIHYPKLRQYLSDLAKKNERNAILFTASNVYLLEDQPWKRSD